MKCTSAMAAGLGSTLAGKEWLRLMLYFPLFIRITIHHVVEPAPFKIGPLRKFSVTRPEVPLPII